MEPAPNQPNQPSQPAANRAARAPWEAANQRPPVAPPGYAPQPAPGPGPAYGPGAVPGRGPMPQGQYPAPHAGMPGPQGYAQGPMPGPQGYPMPGAPYPPMHAPYPMPYPPRKSGMPAWVIVLICAAVGLPILGVLALAAIPLFLSNSSEARRAEAEMMLGGLTGQARVAYAKSGMAPLSLTAPIDAGGCEVSPFELQGTYYIVDDAIGTPRHSNSAYLTAHGISASDGTCQHDFQWQGGNGKYTWR